MTYEPTDWKNREVERPRTFTLQNNDDGTITLIPAEGKVTEPGTPIVAHLMNKIEGQLVSMDKHMDDFIKHTPFAVTTGTPALYEVNLGPTVTTLEEGLTIAVKIHETNTRFPRIDVNGFGAKFITSPLAHLLEAGTLQKNSVYTLKYNSGAFQIQGYQPFDSSDIQLGQWVGWLGSAFVRKVGNVCYVAGSFLKDTSGSTNLLAKIPVDYRPTTNIPILMYGTKSGVAQSFTGFVNSTDGAITIDPGTPVTQIGANTGIYVNFSFKV